MKQVGPGFNALRQAVTAANAADAAHAGAPRSSKAFTEAAAFWKTQPHADAIQWTEDAKRESDAIAPPPAKGEWEAVKAAVPKLQAVCGSCHGSTASGWTTGLTDTSSPPNKAGSRRSHEFRKAKNSAPELLILLIARYGLSDIFKSSTRYCFQIAAIVCVPWPAVLSLSGIMIARPFVTRGDLLLEQTRSPAD